MVDDSAFEVRLMGGLAVLRWKGSVVCNASHSQCNNRISNGTDASCVIASMERFVPRMVVACGSFILTFSVGLVISLEMLLSHDAELLRKLSRFAKTSQLLIIAWLWGLLYWSFNGLDLYGAEPLPEVVVVWVTLFLGTDGWNRFKLGKIRGMEEMLYPS